ncbi:MAG: hypothetical protein KQH63_18150 [Desulfobulbaceae bacterium]|nr:hypothetical protein [Desulfobulbaceae bacterium]
MSKRILFVLSLLLLSNTGCSVYMALNQHGNRSAELFKVGTTRSELIAEFGSPVVTGVTADGRKYEKFVFRKGYSTQARTGRALLHAVADVLTYGLWEVVATPTERSLGSSDVAYEVVYDARGRVNQWAKVKTASDLHHLQARSTPRRQHRSETRKSSAVTPRQTSVKSGFLPYKNYRSGITPRQTQRTRATPHTSAKHGFIPYDMTRTGANMKTQKIASPSTS